MTSDIKLDFQRPERLGFGEAAFCAQKTPEQVAAIIETAREQGSPFLFTRLAPEKVSALPAGLSALLDFDPLSETAYLGEPALGSVLKVADMDV